jgi:aspartyl-tRNA(Asn)/glutamyl-tRNA(Gln) amidotransferase subunit B
MGLMGVVEEDEVQKAVRQAIEENPEAVNDYYNGQKKALNFLVGQVMKLTRGKADPSNTNQLIRDELETRV